MTNKRNNNLDLLRIVCMLMVVGLHTLNHGGLIGKSLVVGSANWYIGNAMFVLFLQAVNCFVLISAYFLCAAKFRLSKLASTWLQAAFYSVGVYLVLVVTGAGGTVFSFKELIKCALVVTMDRYWFVTDYILLFCLHPLLNCAIRAMSRKAHLLSCGVLLLLFSVIPNFICVVDFSGINGGYSLPWFCVLYLLAAYIRLYVPERVKYQKWLPLLFVLLSLVICGERFAATFITPYIFGGVRLTSFFYSYNSVIAVPCALALFQSFRGGKPASGVLSRVVAVIAPLTFAVYLIHEQGVLRPILWNWLTPDAYAQSPWMALYVLSCMVGIFAACCVIEFLRQKLFRLCRVDKAIVRVCDPLQVCVQRWLSEGD